MALTRVGILRGGIGHEYEVSLNTGSSIIKNLPDDKYQPVDILITRDGTWHVGGRPVSPEQAIRGVDVVFNALHGEFGEDGQVQQILEAIRSPYTGSGAVASALGMDKYKAKEVFKKAGFKVPNGLNLREVRLIEALYNLDISTLEPKEVIKFNNLIAKLSE